MARDNRLSRSADSPATAEDGVTPVADSDEIQYFETTVAKIVTDPETGEEYEVMSDNLYPGERLKRDVEAERVKEKEEQAANGGGADVQDERRSETARRYQR